MVRASIDKPAGIVGGFVVVPAATLVAAWKACRARPLRIGDFRAWIACREMVARRAKLPEGRSPAYGLDELAGLCGVSARTARGSIRRLVASGLLEWEADVIGFPDPVVDVDDRARDSIGGGRGSLFIPRRLLRFLAEGASAATIAVALGVLLRCLARRKGGFSGSGRVKSSWIAGAFGIGPRRAKQARADLMALGWIAREPSDQVAMNRWGGRCRIDLGWRDPGRARRRPAPPTAPDRPPIGTPSVDQDPLPEREEDQEPAPGGPAGVEIREQGERTPPTPTPTSTPAPTLDDVRPEDLADIGRLLELHRQAVARGVVTASEADRLRFVAAAEHAIATGRGNPPGLFAYLVRGACWRYITQDDEDRANGRIKGFLRGPGPPRLASSSSRRPARPAPSEDARTVIRVRSALAARGFRGDPFPQVRRHDPNWTRERWEAALAELDGA